MFERGDKKAQGLSTSTIILLVLGILILVILIYGFTQGWGKIVPWLNSENVDEVVDGCAGACALSSDYEYCNKVRELNDDKFKFKTSCYIYANNLDLTKYKVLKCPTINCVTPTEPLCTDVGGKEFASTVTLTPATQINITANVSVATVGYNCFLDKESA